LVCDDLYLRSQRSRGASPNKAFDFACTAMNGISPASLGRLSQRATVFPPCAATFRLRWAKLFSIQRIRFLAFQDRTATRPHFASLTGRWTAAHAIASGRNTMIVEIGEAEPVKCPRQWTGCAAPITALCGLALCSSRTWRRKQVSAIEIAALPERSGADVRESLLHRYREPAVNAANCYRGRSCRSMAARVIAEGREA